MDTPSALMGQAAVQRVRPIYPLDLAAMARAPLEQKEHINMSLEEYAEVHVAETSPTATLTGSIMPDEPPTEQQMRIPSVMLMEPRMRWILTRQGQRCVLAGALAIVGTTMTTMLFLFTYGEGVRMGKQSCPR